MQIGIVGLGRMGGDVAQRLLGGGHRLVGRAPGSAALRDGGTR